MERRFVAKIIVRKRVFQSLAQFACPAVNEAETKKASLDKDFSPDPFSLEPMAVL
jgi:hypothetical protein